MKIAVYTSCATNYYAKACALLESIRLNSPNTSLTLCLCDELPTDLNPLDKGFDRFWRLQDLGYDQSWIFQHNIMELCTGVKGRALQKLMEEETDADLFVYLDPDVYVYNDLSVVLDYLGESSIGLVPHILKVESTDIGVQMTEMSVTEHGIYNLGHLFVRPDSNGHALARWWSDRLDKYCFDDKTIGLFTDQRWMDLVPATFDGVKILRVPNLDVASWNIGGRDIAQGEAGNERSFTVDGWPLITYHFSGTGPSGTHRRVREIFSPSCGAMAEIERHYEASIARHKQKYFEKITPAYDYFDNGEVISAQARKLYRLHNDLQRDYSNPYLCSSGNSFFSWLQEHRPGLVRGLRLPETQLQTAFSHLFDEKYYLSRYTDAQQSIDDGRYTSALDHYINEGSALLYDPCEFFVSRYYVDQAKYLDGFRTRALPRTIKSTLLWHYLTVGLSNGIEPLEFFDSHFYMNEYPDIAKFVRIGAVSSPLAHFRFDGSTENRKPGPSLDPYAILRDQPMLLDVIKKRKSGGVFGALLAGGRILGRSST